MKKLFLSFLIVSSFAKADCELKFENLNECADIKWNYGPVLDQKNQLEVIFDNKEIEAEGEIKFYAWMIMHGGHAHGGPTMTWNEISAGHYEINDARFFMGGMHGYWELRADLTKDGELIDRAAYRIKFND